MSKDFQKWNKLKFQIESTSCPPLFRECEIWWCALGANVGVEQDGKNNLFERPILILYKFNEKMFWGLPMTSKEKFDRYHYPLVFHGKKRTVLLSQLRTLSAKRLVRKIGKIGDHELAAIRSCIISILQTKNGPPVESSGA